MRYFAPNEQTPIEAADGLKHLLKGQRVFDLGAGDGTFALAMSQYADKVVAVEADPELAMKCRERGLETICENFLDVNLTPASVLFVFMSFYGTSALTTLLKDTGWRGTVISHYYPLHEHLGDIRKPDFFYNDVCPLLVYVV